MTTFHDGRKGLAFEDVEAALSFLYNLAPKSTLYLCAHNLEYDLVNLFRRRLRCLEWRFFGGRLMSAKLLGTKITFWDSLHHSYHAPLSSLGKAVGLTKGSIPLASLERGRITKAAIRYGIRDAEIVWKYMEGQQKNYLTIGAEMKTTAPATALDYWRRQFLQEGLPIITEPVRRYFKRGYYGGRVEIFRMKARGRIEYHDVNSLYPTVMLEQYPDISDLHNRGRHGVADVIVDVPDMDIPPLPHRLASGKLVFPVGRFRGSWCTCEIDYAKTLGVRVLKEHSRVGAGGLRRPFKGYVLDCFAARLKSVSPLENTMWKFLLNSLYGKFGTDGKSQKLVDPESVRDRLTGEEFYIGDLVVVDVKQTPPPYANMLWAAWTTALARIRLHRGLLAVARVGEPLYCDTDSIIWRNPDCKRPLRVGKALGQWKREAEIVAFEAKAPKVYQYETREGIVTKAKGVPRTSAAEFFATGAARFRRPFRLKEAARSGETANVWKEHEKCLRSDYDKRIMLADGGTAPLRLSSRKGAGVSSGSRPAKGSERVRQA